MSTLTCLQPNSSVLFDGITPTLTQPDGQEWASQLMTLRYSDVLAMSLTPQPDDFGWRRMEIVLFNCPQWGIGAQDVIIQSNKDTFTFPLSNYTTSCDFLVRVCIQQNSIKMPDRNLSLVPSPGSTWVHVAEITFYRDCFCPPDVILDQSPLLPPSIPPSAFTNSTGNDETTSSLCDQAECGGVSLSTPTSSLRVTLGISIPSTFLVVVLSAAITLYLVCKCCCKGRVVLFRRQHGDSTEQVRTYYVRCDMKIVLVIKFSPFRCF